MPVTDQHWDGHVGSLGGHFCDPYDSALLVESGGQSRAKENCEELWRVV